MSTQKKPTSTPKPSTPKSSPQKPELQKPSTHKKSKAAAYRTSITVALILALLTVIEYFAALAYPTAALLLLLGLVKAYFVVNSYMHISRLWTAEEH
jgi:cytochrome c oxidase subunit IV